MLAYSGQAGYRDGAGFANLADHNVGTAFFTIVLWIFDVIVLVASAIAAGAVYHDVVFGQFDDLFRYMAVGLASSALFVPVMFSIGAYRSVWMLSLPRQAVAILACLACILCFLTLVVFLLGVSHEFSRGTIILFSGFSAVSLIGSRLLWIRTLRAAQARGLLKPRAAFLICDAGPELDAIKQKLCASGTAVTHALDWPKADSLHGWLKVFDRAIPANTTEVVIVTNGIETSLLQPLLAHLQSFPVSVRLILDPFTAEILACPADRGFGVTVVTARNSQKARIEHVAKRVADVVISICALLVLAPMMIIAALAIKIEDGGPIFFCQQRQGWNNRPFRIIKFRSMSVMEDGTNVRQATRNDARVTRVGAFLRSRSIDEVPQFFNVLRGDMSVVGPRPHAIAHDDYYGQMIGRYAFRRRVKPGITGWAQINGLRGETSTFELMEDRVRADLWYIHNWSIWLDLKIIARTVLVFTDKDQAY